MLEYADIQEGALMLDLVIKGGQVV
ncbi:uncharacterized protein METZ01_LOCUS92168, partial [marine metagenome]